MGDMNNMKKIILITTLLLSALISVFSMEWAEYEMLCYKNGSEPSYEEYEYLCEEGATDYGYGVEELEEFYKIISEE